MQHIMVDQTDFTAIRGSLTFSKADMSIIDLFRGACLGSTSRHSGREWTIKQRVAVKTFLLAAYNERS